MSVIDTHHHEQRTAASPARRWASVQPEERRRRIADLREEAVEIRSRAHVAQSCGRASDWRTLTLQAYAKMRAAAELQIPGDAEPARSTLYRDAAALAVGLGMANQAHALICTALAGSPPPYLAAQLCNLWERSGLQLARPGAIR